MNWNLLVTEPAQTRLRRIPGKDRERVKAALFGDAKISDSVAREDGFLLNRPTSWR